ncbi:jg21737 [Pararge aegeria aegeria]|uniref:Jg21737 protein n=1 Tax=Pararge aegeria aegeria TaxID=348720 RepID=A0A8S4S3K7_9NEOP|nr:jg21737 [Pararge aegeria aegeria]
MACATLKRNFDWESMAQLPAKRRRCAPFAASSSTSPGLKMSESKSSIFGETVSAPAKMTPERMAQEICDEIMRLQRRKQLRLATGAAASCSSSSGSEGDSSPPHRSGQTARQKVNRRALFTFKQVRIICERMLSDQEAALRAEYETALSNKLAEQYDAFVRFNIDQVQRRPPPTTCMPLGMDAEHHMHQDLVPSCK